MQTQKKIVHAGSFI